MLKLSLFEGEKKHPVFVSVHWIKMRLNQMIFCFLHRGRSYNSLCPEFQKLLDYYVQTGVRQWWRDSRSDNISEWL